MRHTLPTDLVLPNLTEASLLLEEPYESLSEDRWEDCKRLAEELGPSKILLTKLAHERESGGVAYFEAAHENDVTWFVP